jgi:HSP20 family protein
MDLVPRRERNLPGFFGKVGFGNDGFFGEVDNVFRSLWSDFDRIFCEGCYKNSDGNYVIEIEAPGFSKDNIKVEVSEGVLTVSGSREVKNEASVGSKEIYKRITIGEMDPIGANVENGILTLEFKPVEQVKEVKEIEVCDGKEYERE